MQIGEKIKHLRLSKLMTQADLAGEQITRNMLSSIEHGTALPSLSTAIYIAKRLNVPVGYLLSGDDQDFFYRKMMGMANIRRAFEACDYAGCLSLLSAFGAEQDDELYLIRAECEYGIAKKAFEEGRLRFSAAALDRALRATEKTVYSTAWLRDRIAVCFRYMIGISSTLMSDALDSEEIETVCAFGDTLVEYIMALEALEQERASVARDFIERYPDSLYAIRLSALLFIKADDYKEAQDILEGLLNRDDLTFGVLLYEVFGDLELCYRKNDEYKKAYEVSGSRLGLLEKLLEEV